MARPVTSPELVKLRGDGQACNLYVAFRVPTVVYTALVNGVPDTHDMVAEINYDTGFGTLADVQIDMTMRVFSAIGNKLLGYARIRKTPTSSIFYIGEQSSIDWQDNAVIEISDDYDMWAKHVHIHGTTPKLDYDVTFSNQHTLFNPVPMMGMHRVAKLSGASVEVQLGSEIGFDSWVIGSTITAYAWAIPSALSISDATIARPTATFDTVGWHTCYLTVTAANGKTKQGIRYVYIWDDNNLPATVFKLGDMDEDYQEGGFNLSVEMAAEADTELIQDRALCIVFAVDYYGTGDNQTEESIGPVAGAENIIAIGRIESESIEYNSMAGKIQFRIAGYQQFLKLMKGFPSGLRLKATPVTWVDMPALTIDRALWHFLEWRCTATRIMDITLTGNMLYAKELSSPASSLWSQMEEFTFATVLAGIHIDCYGRFFAEVDPLLIPVADRTYPTVMTITAADWVDSIELERATITRTGQINLSGVKVNLGGTGSAYFSLAPGHVFNRFGEIEIVDRLLVENQTQANKLAGLLFAARNNEYPRLQMSLAGNNRMISCFPNQCVAFVVAEGDTPRGVEVDKTWIPRRRKLSYDNEIGFLAVELELEAITDTNAESVAVNGDIPGSSDFSFPPLPPLPDIPPIDIILPGTPMPTDAPQEVLVHDNKPGGVGLIYTTTFHHESPEWYTVNDGLTQTQLEQVNHVVICPNGAIYACRIGYVGDGAGSEPFIARAPAIGGTFEIIHDVASIRAFYEKGTDNGCGVFALNCNPLFSETVGFIIADRSAETGDAFYGSSGSFIQKANLPTLINQGALSYGLGVWLFTCQGWQAGPIGQYRLLTSDLGSVTLSENLWNYTIIYHKRLGTSGTTMHYGDHGTMFISTDNCDDTVEVGYNLSPRSYNQFAHDTTGAYLMMVYDTPLKGKSSDGGVTWSDLTGLPLSNRWCFGYAGGFAETSRWVAGSAYLRYSDDFGVTWITKQGNLADLDSLYYLDIVKVIGFS